MPNWHCFTVRSWACSPPNRNWPPTYSLLPSVWLPEPEKTRCLVCRGEKHPDDPRDQWEDDSILHNSHTKFLKVWSPWWSYAFPTLHWSCLGLLTWCHPFPSLGDLSCLSFLSPEGPCTLCCPPASIGRTFKFAIIHLWAHSVCCSLWLVIMLTVCIPRMGFLWMYLSIFLNKNTVPENSEKKKIYIFFSCFTVQNTRKPWTNFGGHTRLMGN